MPALATETLLIVFPHGGLDELDDGIIKNAPLVFTANCKSVDVSKI